MLQKDRLYRIQEKMKQTAMPQMLVTDPMAIYWLCGKLFAPGEGGISRRSHRQRAVPF